MRSRTVAVLAAAVCCAHALAGDLNPPPGAINPTDRVTLNGQAITLPHTITTPGSYVLTSDLVYSGVVGGVIIDADHVTLDLNGFSIVGGGAGSGIGIEIINGRFDIAIVNGVVRDWGSNGISANTGGANRFERLGIIENGSVGLSAGEGAVVRDCQARGNGIGGIFSGVNSVVARCTAINNGGEGISVADGSVVRDSEASANASTGIFIRNRSRAVDCAAFGNAGHGVAALNASLISGCTANGNGLNGIFARESTIVRDSVATFNQFYGIELLDRGGAVIDCSASYNESHGIATGGAGLIRGNTCEGNNDADNFAAGIFIRSEGNRIEANNCNANGVGIGHTEAADAFNIVLKNTCRENVTANYDLGGNTHGPIITVIGVGDISGVAGADHPWANFEF